MIPQQLQQHWALAVAGGLAMLLLLMLAVLGHRGSARGQLRVRARELRRQEKALKRASKLVDAAQRRLKRLQGKSDSVKPRVLQEAKGKLSDLLALRKIAHDQVLIARNQVRKIIIEEYPPKRHEAMRRRLLPGEKSDGKPFSMQS